MSSIIASVLAGLCIILSTSLSGCSKDDGSGSSTSNAGISLNDALGREVLFERPAERVVSLSPAVTEILYAIGAGDKVVGVTIYDNFPPEVKGKEKVGDFSNPSMERIISLRPDVVFISPTQKTERLARAETLGLKIVAVHPVNLPEVYEAIKLIGKVVGEEQRSVLLVKKMMGEFSQLKRLVSQIPRGKRRRVYIELSQDPFWTAGKSSFVGQLVEVAGGDNIADLPLPYGTINPEVIIQKDPEVIIIAHPGIKRDEVGRRLGWARITAIQTGRVYDDIDVDMIIRYGPRLGQGARDLFKRFYPEMVNPDSENTE